MAGYALCDYKQKVAVDYLVIFLKIRNLYYCATATCKVKVKDELF